MGAGASKNDAHLDKEEEMHTKMLKEKRGKLVQKMSNSTGSMVAMSSIQVPDVDHLLLCFSALLDMMCSDSKPEPSSQVAPEPGSMVYAPKSGSMEYNKHNYKVTSRGRSSSSHPALEVSDPNLSKEMFDFSSPTPENVYNVEHMFQFLKKAFSLAQWSPECHVISAVYIGRLIVNTKVRLHRRNWVRIVLIALLLAQKVWDDKCLPNSEFPTIWKHAGCANIPTVQDINKMEASFLNFLHYDVHVPRQLYTKYYFEMRTLHPNPTLAFPLSDVNDQTAEKLERCHLGKTHIENLSSLLTGQEKRTALKRNGVRSLEYAPSPTGSANYEHFPKSSPKSALSPKNQAKECNGSGGNGSKCVA